MEHDIANLIKKMGQVPDILAPGTPTSWAVTFHIILVSIREMGIDIVGNLPQSLVQIKLLLVLADYC